MDRWTNTKRADIGDCRAFADENTELYLIMTGIGDIDSIDLDNFITNTKFSIPHGSSVVSDLGYEETVSSFLVRSSSQSSCDGEPEARLIS